jgi:Trypsin-co-occurring domain 1
MSTQFLRLSDGIIIQIDGPPEYRQEMHTSTAEQVGTNMQKAADTVGRILKPLAETLGGVYNTLNAPVALDAAEIELGLSFSAEGNLFVASSKAEGTLKVKMTFKPSPKRRPQEVSKQKNV